MCSSDLRRMGVAWASHGRRKPLDQKPDAPRHMQGTCLYGGHLNSLHLAFQLPELHIRLINGTDGEERDGGGPESAKMASGATNVGH